MTRTAAEDGIESVDRHLNHLMRQLKIPPALGFVLLVGLMSRTPAIEVFGTQLPLAIGAGCIIIVVSIIYADCAKTVKTIEDLEYSGEEIDDVYKYISKKSGLFNPYSETETVYDLMGILLINIPFLIIFTISGFVFGGFSFLYVAEMDLASLAELLKWATGSEPGMLHVLGFLCVSLFRGLMLVSFLYSSMVILETLEAAEGTISVIKMIVHGITSVVLAVCIAGAETVYYFISLFS